MGSLLRAFIATQQRWSRVFDRALPARFSIDGASDFKRKVAPAYVLPGMTLCDVGGGKHPFFGLEEKARLNLTVKALDISERELAAAPVDAYDAAVCADICAYRGDSSADLAICQAVLEHVKNTNAAIEGLVSLLKPGGIALVWVPCRNALFARLNMLLPESWKQRVMFTIFPQTQGIHGFPAYYDRCTPRDYLEMAKANGVQGAIIQSYYMNSYFSFLLPLHVMWRVWQLIARSLVGDQACESFYVVLRKPLECDDDPIRFRSELRAFSSSERLMGSHSNA